MDEYKVKITEEAESQIEGYLEYLLLKFKSEQAYNAVKDDYYHTLERLSRVAGAQKIADDPRLASLKIRKIFFEKHDYVMLYRLNGDVAEILKIFHALEDYTNKI